MRNEKARRFLLNMRKKPGTSFEAYFPKADKGALKLLRRLLAFDPAERPTSGVFREDRRAAWLCERSFQVNGAYLIQTNEEDSGILYRCCCEQASFWHRFILGTLCRGGLGRPILPWVEPAQSRAQCTASEQARIRV